MRIFRFDPEVSIPIGRFGSNFRIGPLTDEGSNVRVQVMHLPPGGAIGRHPAAALQLFAVVSGTGWVSGADGVRREIGPGQAALWDQGEEHEAGSEAGLTAVGVEGEFEMAATSVTREIVVADYDPEWPRAFEEVRDHLWPALEGLALRIDHVGSTAVPGLAAKPIIDMDVVVTSAGAVHPVIDRLAGLGYRWRGDLGISGRQAFRPPRDHALPAHNLYLVVENNKAHLDHLLLRDLLHSDPKAREEYAALKRRNVDIAQGDMDVYVAAKAAMVEELLARARRDRGLPPEPATLI
ncbi:MAG: GrpB family protein [Candidatus Dormibacteraeota bacterium]|nr:GrpB family protein [Candidatus Dormibacteraeota bacterium]